MAVLELHEETAFVGLANLALVAVALRQEAPADPDMRGAEQRR